MKMTNVFGYVTEGMKAIVDHMSVSRPGENNRQVSSMNAHFNRDGEPHPHTRENTRRLRQMERLK